MRRFALALLCLLTLTFSTAWAQEKVPAFPRAPIEIQRADGSRLKVDTEWAISQAQQSYGLMFRQTLDSNQGMLFVFAAPQTVSFWMKNTLIPLDMLFFGPDLRLKAIQADTRPLDETLISPPVPVSFVLEVPAGTAARARIQKGDFLVLPYKNK